MARKQKRRRGLTRIGPDRFRIRVHRTDPRTGQIRDVRRVVEARTVAEAEAKLAELRAEVATPKPDARPSERKLRDYAEQWLKRMARRWKPSTLTNYAELVAIISVDLGDFELGEIDRAIIATWRDQQAELVGPTTVNNRLRCLRAILSEAERDAIIRAPNFDRMYLPEREPDRVLRPAELEVLLSAVRANVPQWFAITLFLARTGCRWGEAVALTWDKVDLEAGTCRIDANVYRGKLQDSAKGEDRTIPLTHDLRRELRAHRQRLVRGQHRGLSSGLVFPNGVGRYLTPGVLSKPWKKARAAAEITRPVSPHWLRHTLHDAVRARCGEVVASAIVGHKSKSMSARYSKPSLAEMLAAIETAFGLDSGTDLALDLASEKKAADAATSTAGENP